MVSPNEFWLCLHQLATAHGREGLTPDERINNVIEQFLDMPPIAQRELLSEMVGLVSELPEIYSAAVAAASDRENAKTMQAVG